MSAWSPMFDDFERHVRIEPVGDLWRVEADGLEGVCFRSGAAAERHGRRLLRALADAGFDATLDVWGRNGGAVASVSCAALPPLQPVPGHRPGVVSHMGPRR